MEAQIDMTVVPNPHASGPAKSDHCGMAASTAEANLGDRAAK